MGITAIPSHISSVIKHLRLVLMVMVVYIHSKPVPRGTFGAYDNVYDIVSGILCSVAVPLFFVFSGYLFFAGGEFSAASYVAKLKKRARTLLLPYVIWSLAFILLLFVFQRIAPAQFSNSFPLVSEFSAGDWWNAMWVNPIQYQFWFLRDLMVTIVLSPLIWALVRYLKLFAVAALGIPFLLSVSIPVPGLGLSSLFFFSLGAFFSLFKVDFVQISRRCFYPVLIVYVLLVAASIVLGKADRLGGAVHGLGIIAGLFCYIGLADRFSSCLGKLPEVFYSSSFFIYAFHGIPILFAMRILEKGGLLSSPARAIGAYFIVPVLIIAVSIILYSLLRKLMPRLTGLITGGR